MEPAPLKRKLIAVLLADVVGYSRLMGADEEGTHLRLNRVVDEVMEPRAREYGGRMIRTMGDALRVEFDSALDAVRCGLGLQLGLAEWEENLDAGSRIQLRIGINTGDVILGDQDIYGHSINIAARLEQLAEPGSIYVSYSVYDQLRSFPGLTFVDRGQHRVKNIHHMIRAFRVDAAKEGDVAALDPALTPPPAPAGPFYRHRAARLGALGLLIAAALGLAAFSYWSPGPELRRNASILVLPFRNVGNDPSQQYFADAVTEDVTTDLSRMRDVTVISAATAFTYKTKPPDAAQIYREIGVRYLLIGSIRRVDKQVRTNIQLIDAKTGVQLWGESFQNEFVNLMSLEESITGRIAASLGVELVRAEGSRAEQAAEPDALDLRLRATGLFFQAVTPKNTLEARRLLAESLRLDPNSAEAWARLAQITASDYLNHWNNTGADQLRDAEEALRKALLLDPNLALAHLASGFIHRARGEHQMALDAFTRAIELDPNFALAYAQKGAELSLVGRAAEAQPLVEQAIKLSPRDPSLGVFYWFIGRANFYTQHYDQAIVWLRKSVEARPNIWYNRLYLVSAYALNGNTEDAKRTLAEFNQRFPKPVFTVAYVTAEEGSNPSSDASVIAARAKFHEGLLRAGMPEK